MICVYIYTLYSLQAENVCLSFFSSCFVGSDLSCHWPPEVWCAVAAGRCGNDSGHGSGRGFCLPNLWWFFEDILQFFHSICLTFNFIIWIRLAENFQFFCHSPPFDSDVESLSLEKSFKLVLDIAVIVEIPSLDAPKASAGHWVWLSVIQSQHSHPGS